MWLYVVGYEVVRFPTVDSDKCLSGHRHHNSQALTFDAGQVSGEIEHTEKPGLTQNARNAADQMAGC